MVVVSNSGQNCNVFWQVGSSATLGSGSTVAGNILAQASIDMNTSARLFGRALARTGAVTLASNTTDASVCAGVAPPPACPTITLSPATLPNGTVAAAYSQTITGSGGTAPYLFAVTTGSLPPGLTLTTAGVHGGTPTTAGTSTFTIRGTDANGCFKDLTYSVVIAAAPSPPPACPTITLLPASLPNGTVGAAYSQAIAGSGGSAPYMFGVTTGALPAGLTLTSAGALGGTPTTAGTSTFTIRGTDANGCFKELSYTIVVAAAPVPPPTCPAFSLVPATLPDGIVGVAYTQTIAGSGGAPPYRFGVTSGALPAGFTLTASGALGGTPTIAGTSSFTIRGTDLNDCFEERSFTVMIAAPPPVPTLPQAVAVLLALGLTGVGYFHLRSRARTQRS